MARRPISGVVRDGEGSIIVDAVVTLTVYSGAAATCYTAQTGGSSLNNGQTASLDDGSYEFWIDDSDHAITTVFNVTATKTGYATITIPVAA